MRLCLLCALLCLVLAAGARAGESAEGPAARRWFVHVQATTPDQIGALGRRFGHLIVERKAGTVAFDVDQPSLDALTAEGYALTVDLAASQRLQAFAGQRLDSIPGFSCYRTVEESYAAMDSLVAAHPTLASVVEIGDSWERVQNPVQGYRLRVLKLTNAAIAGPKPKLFAMFAIHAREYTTAELGLRLAEQLLAQYGKDPQATWLLDHNEFHFLIQANPDGRKQAEAGILWRKNTDDANGTCGVPSQSNHPGIDLNRNYPYNWNTPLLSGSSDLPCNEVYRGPLAASEPETQAVVNYVAGTLGPGGYSGGLFPDLRADDRYSPAAAGVQGLFLDVHSYSRLVMWPWGDTQSPAPDATALQALGERVAFFDGYVAFPSVNLYPSDGTTIDNFYGYLGLPALTIELGVDFFEDCGTFAYSTYPANAAALLYAARTLHAPLQLPAGPDVTDLDLPTDLAAPGDPLLVRATLDDSRGAGHAGSQTIASAQASIDALPWDAGATLTPLVAADGVFSAAREEAFATLPSAGLSLGRHLLYVQGRDADGHAGPPQAAFLEVAPAGAVGQVQGFVYDAQAGLPMSADVLVSGGGDTHSAQSAANDGAYARSAHAGAVQVQASAPGYLDERRSGSVAGGAVLREDFALLPLCQRFLDTAETGSGGFIVQAPWGIANNVAGNATRVWTDSPAGNYANGADASLTTHAFHFSGQNQVTVEFDDKCATEPDYDFGHLEIALDPAATQWTEVYRCSGRPTWQHHVIGLPQATDAATLSLRFHFTADFAQTFEGWSLDNIRVSAGGLPCRQSYGDVLFQDGFDPLQ
jgi:hypothetical protein